LVKVHEILEVWKIRNKKIIHKPMNQGQSMKHNRACVTLQETLNETNKKNPNLELSFGTQELPIQKTIRGSTFPSGLFI
jgi:hypothetical protein